MLNFFFILFLNSNAYSSSNQQIINHLKNINSLQFKFTQRIDNNNIEKYMIDLNCEVISKNILDLVLGSENKALSSNYPNYIKELNYVKSR